jgi:hypothetical protein
MGMEEQQLNQQPQQPSSHVKGNDYFSLSDLKDEVLQKYMSRIKQKLKLPVVPSSSSSSC